MINKQILNYEIKSLIGEGGMGNVYLAEHTAIGRKVAIKVLRPELAKNEEIRKRFKNEASVMAHLQHPNIVNLIDYYESEEGLFLIMEYVEGQELTDLLKSLSQPLSIDRSITIMKGVLGAFSYAHANGVVHRDVKPANIIVGPNDEPKVLDFGIAKLVGDSQFNLTKTGTQVGTVYYMSPEQVRAEQLDQRSDIYSLGVTFYELLAGYCPYKTLNSEFEIYNKIVREDLLPLTEVMGAEYEIVWNAIKKATHKDPAKRYQSCEDFLEGLNEKPKAKSEPRVSVAEKPEPPEKQRTTPKKKETKTWLKIARIAFIAFIGLIVVSFLIEFSQSPDASFENVDIEVSTDIQIAGQSWMKENLSTIYFNNGDPIPIVYNNEDWEKKGDRGQPACCYYDNDIDNKGSYGVLYNYWAITDPRGIAPEGYRVPNDEDWSTLMRNVDITKWDRELNLKYGGHRRASGDYGRLGQRSYLWSVSKSSYDKVLVWVLPRNPAGEQVKKEYDHRDGMYVRCIRK